MGAEESKPSRKGPSPPRFDVIKLRVVPYTVSVTHDLEPNSEEICRLPRNTVVEVVEEKVNNAIIPIPPPEAEERRADGIGTTSR